MDYTEIQKLMAVWAKEAGNRILEVLSSANLGVVHKSTNAADIVTKADTVSEDYLREQITQYFPDHKIYGEEKGIRKAKSHYTWVLDPVDGTLSMALGTEYFGVSIGLWEENRPIIGVIYFPKLGTIIETVMDKGTFVDGKRTYLHEVQRISDEQPVVAFDYSARITKEQAVYDYLVPLLAPYGLPSASYVGYTPIYGSFVYSVLQLLQGKIHAYLHPGPTIYDIGAGLLAIKEAGGEVITVDRIQTITLQRKILPAIIMAWSPELAERLQTRLNYKDVL